MSHVTRGPVGAVIGHDKIPASPNLARECLVRAFEGVKFGEKSFFRQKAAKY